jgi:hypothetical protein
MMPPAPPPAGNTEVGTGGISEYGGTVAGCTGLGTTGTEPLGPGMAQIGSPLTVGIYARGETQTDAILHDLYPAGTVRVKATPRTFAGTSPGVGAAPPTATATPPGEPGGKPPASASDTPEMETPRSGTTIPFDSGSAPVPSRRGGAPDRSAP